MNIKYVLGILVVILLICNSYCIYEMEFSNQPRTNIIIGDKLVKVPDNFSSNDVKITNGSDIIEIFKFKGNDINSAIAGYKNQSSDNFTISVNDFDSKFPSKKTVATVNGGNASFIKYWFVIDNNIYQLQFNGADGTDYDGVAKNMINSIS